MITEDWIRDAVSAAEGIDGRDDQVARMKGLLTGWADGFARVRADVRSPAITWPRRGIHPDEAGSFLRAIDTGAAVVDEAGFVTVTCTRAKSPPGRYALFSRNGDGVAVNLEYLIQVGAAAELALDLGWPRDDLDFERGEFDLLGSAPDGRVVLAMEAKARVSGADSLAGLLSAWLALAATGEDPPATNAGRKYRQLQALCASGPVGVWLVADSARWSLHADSRAGKVTFTAAGPPYAHRT